MSRYRRLATGWGCHLILLLAILLAGSAQAEYLGNVTFDQPQHSFMPHGVQVNVSIDYKIDVPEGRRIYVIPYTDGAPTPGYGVSGSIVYGPGTGTATSFFMITGGGPVVVNSLRVYTRDPDFTETPLEMFVPVVYRYGPHGAYNIQFDRSEYSHLPHGMDLNIDFDFAVDAPGCKIYARPFTDGVLTPGYSASGSIDLGPSGSYHQNFSFDGDADVTDVRFQIYALDNTTLLDEFFVPFDVHWREWGVYDISLNYESVTSLHNSQNLVASFTFDHTDPGDIYVWAWSIQDGDYCPGSVYEPSPTEPPGAHAVTRYTRVNLGTQDVHALRIIVGLPMEIYMQFDIPILVDYGPHALQNIEFAPGSPAILDPTERLEMTYDYLTDEAAGVRIYGRAAFNWEALFGMTSAGSPVYPAPSGSGDFYMYYDGGMTANQIRFQMVSIDQSETFLEWFEPGYFIWGSSGTISDVFELPPAVATLGLCYPNPFNPTSTVPVVLGRDTHMHLAVYDVRGRHVATLHNGMMTAGEHRFTFQGEGLASGAYICKLETPAGLQTQMITLVK